MGRNPDPHGKTSQLIIKAGVGREDHVMKIKAIKEVCLKDGLRINDEILNEMENWLKRHNWPPGNPQHLIVEFTDGKLCELEKPELFYVHSDGRSESLTLDEAKQRGLIKR